MPVATGVRIRADLALGQRRASWRAQWERLSTSMKVDIKRAIERNTIRMWQDAVAHAPVRTGALKEAIHYTFFDDGLTGSVYVGRMTAKRTAVRGDRLSRQLFGRARSAKVPIYVEFGTETATDRPYLLPALRRMYPQFEADCRAALQSSFGG